MKTLVDLQKIWQQTVKTTPWPQPIKTWSHFTYKDSKKNKYSSQPPRILSSKNCWINITRFTASPLALQKSYLQCLGLSSSEILVAKASLEINDCWLVQVKIKGEAKLEWQPDSHQPVAVGFLLQGQGSLSIREQAPASPPIMSILLQVGVGVELNYTFVHNYPLGLFQTIYQANLANRATLFLTGALAGRGNVLGSILAYGEGVTSNSNISLGLNLFEQSRTYIAMLNAHQAANSLGNMLVKTAVSDQAQAVIEAMIKIDKKSFGTDSYLQEDSLLLSPQAQVVVLPDLEIKNRDVKASHGATIGHFDPNLRFYLASRGLSPQASSDLLLSGFFQPIGGKIKNDLLRNELLHYLVFKH
jgi:hypothetical protein